MTLKTRAQRRPMRRARASAGERRASPPLPMPAVLLDATEEPDVAEVPARTVLAVDGAGPPDEEPFARSLGALYGAAYGLKFARKKAGRGEFKVQALEGRWWAEGAPGTLAAPREAWRWRLRLAVPANVRAAEVAEVVRAAVSRKGGKLEGSEEARRVRLERVPKATLGRVLHVGPYADEPRSFARIDAALAAAGLRPAREHLEIYLSDPRRTPAARLRTVLLREVFA
ncbi:MAG TPA: GyrI-like domain-containing protein [Anaeromyxobacter sp.]|nr:GyrI-like domain-containing protein [Anaeromyxobacter sp.]